MEENTVEAPQPQENKKVLSLIGIEAAIVLVVALIVVGVLNYFNILSLSKNYPQIFGFLPHQPYEINKNSINNSFSPPSTGNIIYATKQANKDLPAYVKSSLKTPYIPTSFNIIQAEGVTIRPNKFISNWKVGNVEFFADLGYQNKDLSDKNILILLPDQLTGLDISKASTLVDTYFATQTQGDWKCGEIIFSDPSKTKGTICEKFQSLNNLKKGVGILSLSPGSSKSSIFSCELNPNSSFYNSKSCEPEKADSGVR